MSEQTYADAVPDTTALPLPPAVTEPAKPRLRDLIRSFNGYEERAIEQAFGSPFEDLSSTFMGRAALFVLKRRESGDETEALRVAMMSPLSEVDDAFADAGEDAGSPEA